MSGWKKYISALFVVMPSAVLALSLFPSEQKSVISVKAKQEESYYTEKKLDILVTASQPQFTIKLISNPTTGYSWFLREYDRNIVQPVKHEYQPAQDKNTVGAPGYELWTFQVQPNAFKVPQQSTLRMVYVRPWQSEDNPTQVVFRVMTK